MDSATPTAVGCFNGGDILSEPLCSQCTLEPPKVPGHGCTRNPLIALVGEAPGYNEVQQGKPFVGQAGRVVRRIIDYLKIPKNKVYMTNVCMCRPPGNRDPSAEEVRCCWPRLGAELQGINPTVIVTMGAVPSRVLFPGRTLGQHRGRLTESILGLWGLPTYHPAAMLYPKGATLFPYLLRDITKAFNYASGGVVTAENPNTDTVVIDSEELMYTLIGRLNELPQDTTIAFDWETTGTNPDRDIGFCMSLSWKPTTAVVIPHKYIRTCRNELADALNRHRLSGFNAAMFDSQFNAVLGLPSIVFHDAMLMHYALDERPQQRSLENLTVDELDAPAYESEMMMQYKCSKKDMIEQIPAEVVYAYCGKDADWSLRLSNYLEKKLLETPELYSMYQMLLIPGAHTFAEIRRHGVWVDRERLEEVTEDYANEVASLEKQLQEVVGVEDFNPRSHKQVQEYLWDTLELTQPEIYGREPRSANAETLNELLENYPEQLFPDLLKQYRSAYTIYSRYLRNMNSYVDADGRVRVQYHLDRTETGRLSTTDPAIHQTPRNSRIRTIYAAPPGFALIQADYSQVEMRMAAHCAGDSQLAQLFQELEDHGSDFHTFMASKAFKVPVEEVSKDQRQAAKVVSFGILYRMSVKGLAAQIGVTKREALSIIKDYEGLMPGVTSWIWRTENQIRGQGYVTSIFGRRRRFPFITDNNLAELKREAVNFPVQSAASDLTLTKVIELHQLFKGLFPEVHIVIMVHDEIVVECPVPLVPLVAPMVKSVMETPPFETDIPFPVEVNIGTNWGEGELFENRSV